ncbi:MAG: phage holin family protein [bacterium]
MNPKVKVMSEFLVYKLENIFRHAIEFICYILLIFEEVSVATNVMLILIVIDQITGVWSALKNKKFKWVVFNQFYAKIILYLLAVISLFLYESYLLGIINNYFTKALITIIGFQELKSAYNNISEILGIDALTKFIEKVKKT